jgi:hypothetical protein
MTYRPTLGTIAARAIEHIETLGEGAEISTTVLAEALDADPKTIGTFLLPSLHAGLVKRRKRPDTGRLYWWSLSDGRPVVVEPDPLPHRNVAPEVKPRPGAMVPGGVRGDEPVHGGRGLTLREIAEAEEQPAATPAAFDCWLSGTSGELVLQGVAANDEGDLVLTSEQVEDVRRLLAGRAPL